MLTRLHAEGWCLVDFFKPADWIYKVHGKGGGRLLGAVHLLGIIRYVRRHKRTIWGNCDFSRNNNIWPRFNEFLWQPFGILLGYFYYDRLIGISLMSFLAAILNWNFRIQTSNFRNPR